MTPLAVVFTAEPGAARDPCSGAAKESDPEPVGPLGPPELLRSPASRVSFRKSPRTARVSENPKTAQTASAPASRKAERRDRVLIIRSENERRLFSRERRGQQNFRR